MTDTSAPPRKRKWFKTKAEWAEAKVQELEALLEQLRADSVPSGNWRRVRSKMAGIDNITQELTKYRRLAKQYREQGE